MADEPLRPTETLPVREEPPPPPAAAFDTQPAQPAVSPGSNQAIADFLKKPSVTTGVAAIFASSFTILIFTYWVISAGHMHFGASWGGHNTNYDARLTGIAEVVDGLAVSCNAEQDEALERLLRDLSASWTSANADQGNRYGSMERGLKAVRKVVRKRCMRRRRVRQDDDLDGELDEEADES